jgi:multidrug efflux pump
VGGMIAATIFSIFFVPIFFSVVLKFFKTKPKLLGPQVDDMMSELELREEKDLIYSEAYPELDPYRDGKNTKEDDVPQDANNKKSEE